MGRRRHPCPGCGASVPRHLLACAPCWRRLPEPLRRKVNIAYSRRHHDPTGHREAVAEATAWYRRQKEANAGV